jgi:hypothetical protein
MVVNDNASNQMPSGVVAFFASKLAPTGLQDCRIAGLQDCRIAGLQDCRITGLQDPKITYI